MNACTVARARVAAKYGADLGILCTYPNGHGGKLESDTCCTFTQFLRGVFILMRTSSERSNVQERLHGGEEEATTSSLLPFRRKGECKSETRNTDCKASKECSKSDEFEVVRTSSVSPALAQALKPTLSQKYSHPQAIDRQDEPGKMQT